jgi:hypothetical protein
MFIQFNSTKDPTGHSSIERRKEMRAAQKGVVFMSHGDGRSSDFEEALSAKTGALGSLRRSDTFEFVELS